MPSIITAAIKSSQAQSSETISVEMNNSSDTRQVTPSTQQLIILHEKSVTREHLTNIIRVSPRTCQDVNLYASHTLPQLLGLFDVVLIDLSDNAQLALWDMYKGAVTDNTTVVFIRRRGVPLDIDRTKKTLLCDYARKFLPEVYHTLDELITKLSSDHISSKVLKASSGLMRAVLSCVCK
jgi:hypothetical protein